MGWLIRRLAYSPERAARARSLVAEIDRQLSPEYRRAEAERQQLLEAQIRRDVEEMFRA